MAPEVGLPEIGGFAFGVVLSAVLELGKAWGLVDEDSAPWVALALGVLWGGVAVAVVYWPEAQPWFVAVVQAILALASLPIGAKVGYKAVVQPLTKERWNKNS